MPSADDPTEYALVVKVRNQVSFTTQSGKRPIAKGTPPFESVSGMEKGDCVVISGVEVEPAGQFALAKLCDPRFFLKFTAIDACQ